MVSLRSLTSTVVDPEPLADPLASFPIRYARTARFTLGAPRTFQVVDGGRRVLFCRSRDGDDPVLCLWSVSLDDGRTELIVDPRQLDGADGGGTELPAAERARRERARESAAGIVAYSTDRSGRRCCFALGGELFVVEVSTGEVRSLPTPGGVFDPRLDPGGTAVAYTAGRALRIHVLDNGHHDDGHHGDLRDGDGPDRVLRIDEDPLVSHGRAEFVAAEEMGRGRGFWWAPDGTRLLATRVDENPVSEWWIGDPAHPDRPPTAIRYPAAGTANAIVGLELIDLDGTARPVDWSEGGRYEYLADVVWTADRAPLVVRQPRDQRTVSIAEVALDGATDGPMTVGERYRVDDDTWVELVDGTPRWCRAGLVTVEDRDQARCLVVDGHAVTGPELQVRRLLGVVAAPTGDPGSASSAGSHGNAGQAATATADGADREPGQDWAIVAASAEPTEVGLYAVPLPGPGSGGSPDPVLLTPTGTVNGGALGGRTLVVIEASPDRPRSRARIHDLDDLLAGRAADGIPIEDRSAEPGFAAAPTFVALGPDRLASALFLPRDHDGATPLPVLLDPYGGPHAQRVLKAHNPHLVSRWLAEQGYAVLVTDGRGTPARGPAWERAVWGDLAGPVLDDQLAALDAALDAHDHLDGDRVAIRGWSFGGYLAALAVLRRPDRFHAAIAGAPVTSWHLYDTHYTERYLGHPATHPEHYRRSDLYLDGDDGPELDRLQRPLLLIHGLADDNVVAAHTLRFSTALLATGSPHRVLPLSGVTHMTPQEAVAENLLRLQLDFLDSTIGLDPIGPPPARRT